MSFFNAIKALFPRSKAFEMIQDSSLRKFVKGLSRLPDDVKANLESVYLDLFPESTRALEEWEKEFGVLFADEQYGDTRQGILKALWRSNTGGQTAEYLQGILQQVDNRILVIENVPVKNPRDANSVFACHCGFQSSVCGNKNMSCGFKVGDSEFVPAVLRNDSESVYDIPVDPIFWENYFFVCGGVVRNSRKEIVYCQKLVLDSKWKSYIEYLILKVKPVQTGALVFIQWVDGLDETRSRNRR